MVPISKAWLERQLTAGGARHLSMTGRAFHGLEFLAPKPNLKASSVFVLQTMEYLTLPKPTQTCFVAMC